MLRAHHVVGAAIGLAGDQGHLRHRRLGKGEQQLRAVLDDAAMLLRGAGQESRHVDKGQDRDVEAIAKPDKARRFARAVDVEAAGQHHRLVGDDPDRRTFDAGEPDQDIAGEIALDLEEVEVVDDLHDQLLHVVGLVRVGSGRACRAKAPTRSRGSALGRSGGDPRFEAGRKSTNRRSSISASTSLSKARSATPERVVWATAPAQLLLGHRSRG